MGLSDDILAVREAVVGVVLATWTGAKVTTETVEREEDSDFAVVALREVGFVAESPSSDTATLEIEILGRFARPAGAMADARLVKAASLRAGLLALTNPGSVGFGTLVSRIRLVDSGPKDDDGFDISVTFTCEISAAR